MTVRRLQRTQWFPRPVAEVFAFFGDPFNLERITPPWLRFRILTPGPLALQAGSRIDYRLRLRGVPVRWQTEITVWEPPYQFHDVQRKGPYRHWEHRHCFTARDGGTWMEDCVDYQVPGGWLEPALHRLIVGPDLRRIFDYRAQAMAHLLGE